MSDRPGRPVRPHRSGGGLPPGSRTEADELRDEFDRVRRNPQARRLGVPQKLPQCEGKPREGMNMPERCSNSASYDLDGHKLCGRHAGAYALRVWLGEDPSDLIVPSKTEGDDE